MAVGEKNLSHTGCREFEEDLVLFHYGELDESVSENIISHLKGCADCRDSLDNLKALMPMTIIRDEPPETFWSDYSRELRQKIDAVAEMPTWWEQLLSWIWPLPLPALAACAVVLLALTFTVGKKYWDLPDAAVDDDVMMIMSTSQDLDLIENLELLDALDVLEAMGTDKGKA